jgi:hypothetical protein
MLRVLYALRKIILPGYWLWSLAFVALSSLPELATITQGVVLSWEPIVSGYDMTLLLRAFEPGAFPSLKVLSFTMGVADTLTLVQHPYYLRHLTHLDFRCPVSQSSPFKNIRHIINAIGLSSPNLRRLNMNFRFNNIFAKNEEDASEMPPLDTLSGIAKINALEYFEFGYPVPLRYDLKDLHLFASKLQKLRHLHLNATPLFTSDRTLPNIDVLKVFAQHCPDLESLGFCANIRRPPYLYLGMQTPIFNGVVHINLGASIIAADFIEDVFDFIEQICPRGYMVASKYLT